MEDGLSKRERAFFAAAEDMSFLSNHRQRIGCVVIDRHHIVGSGHNSKTRKHRFQADIDKKYFKLDDCQGPVHAEVDALLPLIKRKYDLSSATVYVFRHSPSGIGLARPCPRCMQLLKDCGIKKIKYSTPDGFASEKIVY